MILCTPSIVEVYVLDKTLPYKSILMRAEQPLPAAYVAPPPGWHIVPYEAGDETHWAEIETSVDEFEDEFNALTYFTRDYVSLADLLHERCLFAVDEQGHYAGTCTAWFAEKDSEQISSLHWLAVKPEYQHHGLGRALISRVMALFETTSGFPVYLHTQTWSHRAVLLYRQLGFCLLKEERFARYGNDFDEAMAILRPVLSHEQYADLLNSAQ